MHWRVRIAGVKDLAEVDVMACRIYPLAIGVVKQFLAILKHS